MDLAHGRFRVTTTGEAWPRRAAQRMAGVSAFGVGGTNVHLVLEEAPTRPPANASSDIPVVLPLSAKTGEAVRLSAARLAQALERPGAPSLVDVAETLARGRRVFSHRSGIAVRDPADAVRRLKRIAEGAVPSQAATRKVVFMFPGQGAQYPGMAAGLYSAEPICAAWIDRGARLAETLLGRDLKPLLFDAVSGEEQVPHALRDTTLAQPALYIIEYALAQVWISRGVVPSALIGHSLGEFVAAALAGVFSFEDGLRLGVAAATAVLLMPGTAQCKREDIERFLPQVELIPYSGQTDERFG